MRTRTKRSAKPIAMIRCDAGPVAGMGHAMRSLVLAEALSPYFRIIFCMKDSASPLFHLIRRKGHGITLLRGATNESEEIARLAVIARRQRVAMMIIDHYKYGISQAQRLKKETGCLLLDRDDLNRKNNPAHILYNPYWDGGAGSGKSKGLLVLRGYRNLLFRGDLKLLRRKRKISPQIKTLFFSFGGSDPRNLVCKVIRFLFSAGIDLQRIRLRIALGPFFRHKALLNRLLLRLRCRHVDIIENCFDLGRHAMGCDAAFLSGGGLKYELAYLGMPLVTVAQSPIEDLYCRHFARRGLSVHLGPYDRIDRESAKRSVRKFLKNAGLRKTMVRRQACLIPADASVRVGRAIYKSYERWSHGSQR